jgi:hypothetical protein
MLHGLSEAERAALEPPYNMRLDRPYVTEGEAGLAVKAQSRMGIKKEFDEEVFKTKYF